MRVIVTRPRREALEWVLKLGQAGYAAHALPLIDIQAAPEPVVVQQAWRALGQYCGVMFVSANAVSGFFDEQPAQAGGFSLDAPTPRAWATGPGTRKALLNAGLAPGRIDAPADDAPQFDSEALWHRVKAQVRPGTRVLIVRGADAQGVEGSVGVGRDWFAQRVRDAGGRVDFVVSYRRSRPELDAAQLGLVQAALADRAVWLFSSSEAVQNLQACLPGQSWASARAVATHARIAQAVRQAGFGEVRESRPTLADVRASLESFQ